ncbi:MAG: hypothetical protein V3R99_06280 [Thermoguttaceae bacterium]
MRRELSRKRGRRPLVRNPLSPIEPRFSPAGLIPLGMIPDDMLEIFEMDDETTEPYPEIGDFWTLSVRKELER